MSRETKPRIRSFKTALVCSILVFIAISSVVVNLSSAPISPKVKGLPTFNPQGLPLARAHPYLTYDEQAGTTFTQDFSSLAFNVSAVAQTGPDGVGPAYLLNGLTNAGYWYQVGLSWKWPSTNSVPLPGFDMNYEVFNQYGFSVFPTNGGGGIDPIQVNAGDLVLLTLNFAGTDVLMQATDWNTTSSAAEYYPAVGASYFVGLPNSVSSNGFFTGLMTEEYRSAPYYGNVRPVVYQENSFNTSSAWLWVDEFDTNTFQPIFSDATTSPISIDNASLQYFSFHGMAEAISAREFITGLLPIQPPLLTASTSSTSRPGDQVIITLDLQNPNNLAIRIKSLIISTAFGIFNVSSSVPSSPITSNSTFTASITIPTSLLAGNYTLTSIADWQFDPQLKERIAPDPLQANTTITIDRTANPANPHPSTPPPTTPPKSTRTTPGPELTLLRAVLIPALLAYAGAVALVVALVILRERRTLPLPNPTSVACKVCGSAVGQTMLFCPNCGSLLTTPSDTGSISAGPQPPSPP
jgi:hypothetical protein